MTRRRIEQMSRRKIAFAALQGGKAAHAADGQSTNAIALLRKQSDHGVEADILTSGENEIRDMQALADQLDGLVRSGVRRIRKRIDLEEPVGLRECRYRTGPAAQRKRDETGIALAERHHHIFGAAEFGGHADRQSGLDQIFAGRRQTGHGADERRGKGMECKNGGGRKARQHDHRFSSRDGETDRLAGFQRNAVHDDPGFAEPRQDAVRDIARAFRRAARHDDEIGLGDGACDSVGENRLIVAHDAEQDRLAAVLAHRGRGNRGIGIVDCARPKRGSREAPVRHPWK